MIYRFLLSSLLALGITTESIAQPVSAQIESQKNTVSLKNLDFKTVMMAFYQKDIQYVKIPELEHEKLQYVGINDYESVSSGEDKAVLIFNSAVPFRNKNNQLRYLLTLTKFPISGGNSPSLRMGKFQVSQTTIYIFKKNEDGQYQLLSKSAENLLNDDFTYTPYPTDKIIRNIKIIGSKIKGYVEEQEYSQNGYSSTKLIITPFDDRADIKSFEVAEISNDNEVTGSEKTYNTQGSYRFLNSEHDGLYDIEIKYTGTQRVDTQEDYQVIPINETHIYRYNQKQQKYNRVK